jgi:acetate kinase
MSSLPVLVLNSGSSSIKFSVYEAGNGERRKALRGRCGRHRHRPGQVLDQGRRRQEAGGSNASRAQSFGGIQAGSRCAALRRLPCPGGHRPSHGVRRTDRTRESAHHAQAHRRDRKLRRLWRRCTRPSPSTSCARRCVCFPASPTSPSSTLTFIAPCPKWPRACRFPPSMPTMGVRRYGYHGISYESIISSCSQMCRRSSSWRTSAMARRSRQFCKAKCLDTSMGLTPTGGIISGSRTGDIDPGVLIFILKQDCGDTPNTDAAAEQLETWSARSRACWA